MVIPEGFRRIERLSPFNALVGPLYEKRDGDAVSIGLAIEQKHTNSRGLCHGGVLATLADLALGYAMLAKSGEKGSLGTEPLAGAHRGPGAGRRLDRTEGGDPARRLAHGVCQLLSDGWRPADRARQRNVRARRKRR